MFTFSFAFVLSLTYENVRSSGSQRPEGSSLAKLAYPFEQIVNSRPVEGLAEVLCPAPNPRSAWLWLRQAKVTLDGCTPLTCLRSGRKAAVFQAAAADLALERDFASRMALDKANRRSAAGSMSASENPTSAALERI